MAFEKLGPSFVKLGQVLAERPDLIPVDYCEEFKKLKDRVTPLEFSKINPVLERSLGANWRSQFAEFNERPLAAASIAQVYEATLQSGQQVVVKVQRPMIKEIMVEDMAILFFLANLTEKYLTESRIFEPTKIVQEFAKNIELETNFVVEGNNIRRFLKNFKGDSRIKIPEPFIEFTSDCVLVMEKLTGESFAQILRSGRDHDFLKVAFRNTLHSYLKMVFRHGVFHGDLHSGNLFWLPTDQVGLIDFGVIGRLNKKAKTVLSNMLVALADEDYERLAFEYLDLAMAKGPVDIDQFARELADLIGPFHGLSIKHMNTGKILLESAVLASRFNLALPSDLIMFFKSIVVLEGVGRSVSEHFDFLSESLELAKEVISSEVMVEAKTKELRDWGIELSGLLSVLPRQLRQVFRRINDPKSAVNVQVVNAESIATGLEQSSRRIFWGFVAGSLVIGIAVSSVWSQDLRYLGLPVISWVGIVGLIWTILRRS